MALSISASFLMVLLQCSQEQVVPCRRGYTHSRYRRIMDNIRRHMPNASISGDAIVGFPGETVHLCSAACSQSQADSGFQMWQYIALHLQRCC